MGAEIIRLERAPVDDIVDVLEDLLARAKAGEIEGFAFVAALPQRGMQCGAVQGRADVADLHFGLSRAQLQMVLRGAETVDE